jgi:hypothetical protein
MERLRRTGMSIAEMRAYTALVRQGRSTLKQRQDMLYAHRARVLETIAEWTLALKLIDSKIDFYGEWLTTGHRPRRVPEDRVKESAIVLRAQAANPPRRRRVERTHRS